MSRIDDLITEHCPDGVEFVSLKDVAELSKRKVSAALLNSENYVGVDNLLPNKGGKVNSSYGPNASTLTGYGLGDVLIGNIRPYLKKIWIADTSGGASSDVLVVSILNECRSIVRPRYLYYILSSDRFFKYDMKHAKGAKMPRGDKRAVLEYRFQLPPICIQDEIVEMLDKFTHLEAELEVELKAELAARRRQYEHYRDELLTFTKRGGVRLLAISEICGRIVSGGTPRAGFNEYYENGTIPWLRTQEVKFNNIYETELCITEKALKETSTKWVKENSVIIAISGATAGRSAVNKIPLTTNQHCCCLEIDEDIADYRYVFHWLSRNYELIKSMGRGARSDLNVGIIKSIKMPIPSFDEQKRIAQRLDTFDVLVNSISSGLPAEIEARRKQYEYYADRLLTFKEKA